MGKFENAFVSEDKGPTACMKRSAIQAGLPYLGTES